MLKAETNVFIQGNILHNGADPRCKFCNICKSQNGELGNGMRGMMGAQRNQGGNAENQGGNAEIRAGMQVREIRVGMHGIRLGMREMGWKCE